MVQNWLRKRSKSGFVWVDGGDECNATSDAPTTKYAIDNWPRQILFSGYEIGDEIYVDRRATLESIPDDYLDCIWIKGPANDGHRFDLGDSCITFTAHADVTVFVGYDIQFLELMPEWLTEWTDTKDEITNNWGNSYRLFSRAFPKGKVVLGNNTTRVQPLKTMYIVLVKEVKK